MLSVRRVATAVCIASLGLGSACATSLPDDVFAYRVGPCDDFQVDAERVWNTKRSTSLRKAASGVPLGFAERTLAHAIAEFEAFTERWVRASKTACLDTVVRKQLPRANYLALSACYDAALVQEQAVIERLSEPDAEALATAPRALYQVARTLDGCEFPGVYRDYFEDVNARDAAALSRAKANLARAWADLAGGRPARAIDAATRAQTDAERAAVARAHAEALLLQGLALDARGRYRDARARLDIALDMFYEARSPNGAAEALAGLSRVQVGLGSYEIAEQSALQALALRRALFGPVHAEVARALFGLGLVQQSAERHAEALERFREAERIYLETLQPGHPFLLDAQSQASAELAALGRFGEALDAAGGALQAAQARLGEDHPEVARIRNELAGTLLAAGRPSEALAEARRALELRERVHGPQSPEVADTLHLAAAISMRLGATEQALAELQRGLTIRRRALGEQHRLVGESHELLGEFLLADARFDEALSELEKARGILETSLGEAHPRVLGLELRMGGTLLELERYEAASQVFEQARLDLDRRFGPLHPEVATAHMGLGRAVEGLGQTDTALGHYRRALALYEASFGARQLEVGRAHAALARVLAGRREFKEARPHAERAVEIASLVPGGEAAELADALVTRGSVELGLYRRQRGIEDLMRALAMYRKAEASPANAPRAGGATSKGTRVAEQLRALGVHTP